MKKEYILYSLAIGINRGSVLLYLPLLTYSLSLSDYGLYSYIQVLFQVIFPFICFNIPSGIAREGADVPMKGYFVYEKAKPYVFRIIILGIIASFLIEKIFSVEWVLVVILLGGIEALHNMQLSVYRAFDKHLTYLSFVATKTIGLGLIILVLINKNQISLTTVLISQISWYVFVFVLFSVKRNIKTLYKPIDNFDFKPIIYFSILLIPHVVSQWAMSAVNRVIVKNTLGNEAMGIYSISFSLAMIILLINSGIAIVLPQNFIRNPDYWLKTSVRTYFGRLYSSVVVFTFFLILLVLYLDSKNLNILKLNNGNIIYYYSIVTASFFLLGFYYYYANILFYYKKSKTISGVTFVTAFMSILMSYFFTINFGLDGAAYSTLFTYIIYLTLIAYAAKKHEPKIRFSALNDLIIPVITTTIIIISGFFVSKIL